MNKVLRWLDFVAYLALLGYAVVAGPRSTLWYAALVLSVVCASVWLVAKLQLGASFSVRPEARHLVTKGLYSRFRHPIYVFGTPAFLFAVLALQGWPALVIWAVVLPIQVVRASREDRVLAEAFGAEYVAYRQTTWF